MMFCVCEQMSFNGRVFLLYYMTTCVSVRVLAAAETIKSTNQPVMVTFTLLD